MPRAPLVSKIKSGHLKPQFGSREVWRPQCMLWSLASATGFALATREHAAAEHAAAARVHDGWATVVRRAGHQLEAVHGHRPEHVVQAELAAQMVPAPIWKRTRECTELTLAESHDACSRVLALRQELAAAQSAEALEQRMTEARRQLATTPVVGLSADPQVASLSALVGVEEASLRRALALLLGILVEIGSACGFALASAATANPPSSNPPRSPCSNSRPASRHAAPAPSNVVGLRARPARRAHISRPSCRPDPSLARWLESCVRPDRQGCLGARATYEAYRWWAQEAGVNAASETTFGRYLGNSIAGLGGSKVARAKGTFYLGIKLVHALDQPSVRSAA